MMPMMVVVMMPVMVVYYGEHPVRGGRRKQAEGEDHDEELRYLHGRE